MFPSIYNQFISKPNNFNSVMSRFLYNFRRITNHFVMLQSQRILHFTSKMATIHNILVSWFAANARRFHRKYVNFPFYSLSFFFSFSIHFCINFSMASSMILWLFYYSYVPIFDGFELVWSVKLTLTDVTHRTLFDRFK